MCAELARLCQNYLALIADYIDTGVSTARLNRIGKKMHNVDKTIVQDHDDGKLLWKTTHTPNSPSIVHLGLRPSAHSIYTNSIEPRSRSKSTIAATTTLYPALTPNSPLYTSFLFAAHQLVSVLSTNVAIFALLRDCRAPRSRAHDAF